MKTFGTRKKLKKCFLKKKKERKNWKQCLSVRSCSLCFYFLAFLVLFSISFIRIDNCTYWLVSAIVGFLCFINTRVNVPISGFEIEWWSQSQWNWLHWFACFCQSRGNFRLFLVFLIFVPFWFLGLLGSCKRIILIITTPKPLPQTMLKLAPWTLFCHSNLLCAKSFDSYMNAMQKHLIVHVFPLRIFIQWGLVGREPLEILRLAAGLWYTERRDLITALYTLCRVMYTYMILVLYVYAFIYFWMMYVYAIMTYVCIIIILMVFAGHCAWPRTRSWSCGWHSKALGRFIWFWTQTTAHYSY